MSAELPPVELPVLTDPVFDGPGPYAESELRRVVGSRINPDAIGWYKRRQMLTNPLCPAKTCAHPELEGWLGDVGSFDPRAGVVQPAMSEWPFSAVIPRLSIWGEKLAFPLQPATYMIDYPYLNSNPTAVPTRSWVENLGERFPEDTSLLLSFFGNRALTVGLWTLRDFWYAPFLKNFKGVVLPDFSAFSDDPLPQMMFGERMQQIFGQEGSEAGHNIIPSIAWTTEDSLRRQIELWVSQYPRVHTILLDCYGSGVDRTLWTWRWLWAIRKYIAPHKHIRWLIAGLTSGWSIRMINELLPERNYALVMSVSAFVNSTTKTTDKEFMAYRFRGRIKQLEDFRSGKHVADGLPWPESWPSFADALRP